MFILQFGVKTCDSVQVKLYAHARYETLLQELKMDHGKCYDLRDNNDVLSSVEGDCVILYEDYECEAQSFQLNKDEPCRSFLGDCASSFNDKASSLRLCPREECISSITGMLHIGF